MKRIMVILTIYVFIVLSLTACYNNKTEITLTETQVVYNWPTLYFEEQYYQSDGIETIVVPENIDYVGRIESVCNEGELPQKPNEVNAESYQGCELYQQKEKDHENHQMYMYLKYLGKNNIVIFSKWSSTLELKREVIDNWYPSAMVNDQLYWWKDNKMVEEIPENLGYVKTGQILYEESGTASINGSNSIHMLGANIYSSKENVNNIFLGFNDGPYAELIFKME